MPRARRAPAAPPQTTQIAASGRPATIRYRDRRLLVLYFDMTAMPPADQLRALQRRAKFIETQMRPPDLMAIMTFQGGAVRVLQDFTDDRDALRAAIDKLIVGEDQDVDEHAGRDAPTPAPRSARTMREFNIFNTDRQLAALQTAAKMLRPLNEKKALVYFASGLRLNGVDNQAQLRATINAAIRANVSLYPDRRARPGGEAPLGDATRGSPGGLGMYSGSCALAHDDDFQHSQDTLYALARTPAARRCSTTTICRTGIVQAQQGASPATTSSATTRTQHGARRQVPPHQDHAERQPRGEPRLSARATTRTRSSRSSPPPIRSGSSRTR